MDWNLDPKKKNAELKKYEKQKIRSELESEETFSTLSDMHFGCATKAKILLLLQYKTFKSYVRAKKFRISGKIPLGLNFLLRLLLKVFKFF